MRVLMLTQWFDPEPTFKGLLFADELRKRGHDVRVLTGYPNYPGGRLYAGYQQHLFTRENVDGVQVVRVPLYPSHDDSAVRRIANYLSFSASATIASMFVPRPDVVYLYHPPATVAAAAMAMKYVRGVPFVLDVQDLWPETLRATGMLSGDLTLRVVRWGMHRIYGAAAHILVLSHGFKEAIAPVTGPRKVTVVPNWADERQMSFGDELVEGAQARPDDRFMILFAGTMGKAQALTTILDAASQLLDDQVHFVFVGAGIEVERLKTAAEARALDNVSFLARRPVSEMSPLLQSADALLVHLRDDPLFSITIPSKTQAYLMAGRPILMGVRGDAAAMVKEAGAGLVFEPEDVDSLVEAVRRMVRLDPSDRTAMGQQGVRYYKERLALAVGSAAIEEVLVQASREQPRADFVRRARDLMIAAAGITVLSGPLAVIAILIRRRLGSPVIFRQTRPGRYGKPFTMLKLRTMSDERGSDGLPLPDAARLGSFGARVRSLSLDELPTLLNVLRGDMSIVGPRPLLMRYTDYFQKHEARRLDVRPGVTGWAQVNGRNMARWDDRLAMDAWYVENRSLRVDARIILKTITSVLRRSGFVADPETIMRNLDDERREPVVR